MTRPVDDTFISEAPTAPSQALSGALLLGSAVVAMAWANSPWAAGYRALLAFPMFGSELQHAVNDGLMALFFLLVGLEIKHELLDGALASIRQASLPVVGALGGMLVPAALYAMLAHGTPAAAGWGVPMATDIAFALGIVALLGDRVPSGLRVFLAALAIADDLGAVLVIALFYTSSLAVGALAVAAVVFALLLVLNARRVGAMWPYLLLGAVLWYAVLRSGVHASIAGVLLAVAIPARGHANVQDRLEARLQHPVTYGVVPLFALVNAGVTLPEPLAPFLAQAAVPATMVGLVVGKPVGIFGAAWLAVRTGVARLPEDATWGQLLGVAMLGGIGFTMSLFIATLAFGSTGPLDAAKLGILAGSTLAGLMGALVLARIRPQAPMQGPTQEPPHTPEAFPAVPG
jgi:NhaA family Na+:H+ antiporter